VTITKRRITTAERQLHAIGTLAAALEHRWPAITAAADALAPDVLRGTATDRGRGAGGVSDPTSNVALSRDHWQDILDAIGAWQAQGAWISEQVRRYEAETPQAAEGERLKRLASCACSDPDCFELADLPNGMTRRCWERERKRVQRSRDVSRGDVAMSRRIVVRSGIVQPSAPQAAGVVHGTCGRCGAELHGDDAAHVARLLEQHHAEAHGDALPSAASL
jgi:hypothetical protein